MENNLDFTKDSILNRLETRVGSIDPIHGSINLIITILQISIFLMKLAKIMLTVMIKKQIARLASI